MSTMTYAVIFVVTSAGLSGLGGFDTVSAIIAAAACARLTLKQPKLGWVGGMLTVPLFTFMTLVAALLTERYFFKTGDIVVMWALTGAWSLVLMPLADTLTKQAGLVDIVGPANRALDRLFLRLSPVPKPPPARPARPLDKTPGAPYSKDRSNPNEGVDHET